MTSSVASAAARRDRVLLVRVVAERVRAGEVEIVARDARGDRQHAAAERLAEHHDVGRGAVVLGGEEAAGLAEAGRDLVEDQQRAVRVAGLAHRLPVPGGGMYGTARAGSAITAATSPSRSST